MCQYIATMASGWNTDTFIDFLGLPFTHLRKIWSRIGVEFQKLRSFKGVSRNVQENCKKNKADGIDVFSIFHSFSGELCKKNQVSLNFSEKSTEKFCWVPLRPWLNGLASG